MTFRPLADNTVLLDFGNVISMDVNLRVIQFCEAITQHPFPGFVEAVPAYSSAAIFYDPLLLHSPLSESTSVFETVVAHLKSYTVVHIHATESTGRQLRVPVCYAPEFGPDINDIAERLNMAPDEIIRLHTSRSYHIYMMGFLPGFPYMGEVEELLFMPRKNSPVHVHAGSVGMAGRQTGIYPVDSPGGWHILGRTPLKLFDPHARDPVYFRAGDCVTFYPITKDEFVHHENRHS